jgi:hypothetical protein
MNSKNKKERRVVNFDKLDFDLIQSYCKENALNMSRWLVKIAKSQINKHKTNK